MSLRNLQWDTQEVASEVVLTPELKWVRENSASNSFAASLNEYHKKNGKLSDAQIDAVRKKLAPKPEAEQVSVENVKAIQDAFKSAKEKGIKYPKMNLADFKLKAASANAKNPNSIYVTSGDDYLGSIADSNFFPTRNCSEAQRAEIVQACSNPHKAAVAYGQRTGNCAICNRVLSRADSITLGVGAICAEKYGFSGFAAQFDEAKQEVQEDREVDLFSQFD